MIATLAKITQQTLNPGRIPLAHVPMAEAAPGRTNALCGSHRHVSNRRHNVDRTSMH